MSFFRCALTTSTILAVTGLSVAGAQAAASSGTDARSGKSLTHKAAASGSHLKSRAAGRTATDNTVPAMPGQSLATPAPTGRTLVSLSPSQGLPEVMTVSALRRPIRADDVGSSVTV